MRNTEVKCDLCLKQCNVDEAGTLEVRFEINKGPPWQTLNADLCPTCSTMVRAAKPGFFAAVAALNKIARNMAEVYAERNGVMLSTVLDTLNGDFRLTEPSPEWLKIKSEVMK